MQEKVKVRLKAVIEKNLILAQQQERLHTIEQKIELTKENTGAKSQRLAQAKPLVVPAEPFEKILSEHKEDPIISFRFGKKPEPKKVSEAVPHVPENRGRIAGKSEGPMIEIEKRPEGEYIIGEQGKEIQLEGNEGGALGYCKSRLSKYFC